MSVEGQPTVPEEQEVIQSLTFTWAVAHDPKGDYYVMIVPVVNGQIRLERATKLTSDTDDLLKLFYCLRKAIEGGDERPLYLA